MITISIDETMELVEQFMDRRMDLSFVNWYVGERSQLYEDWAIQGVPTYVVVDRDGVVRGRSHEVESLYDVILEATGADGYQTLDLAQPEYDIEAQEWITMSLAANASIWTPPAGNASSTASKGPHRPLWTCCPRLVRSHTRRDVARGVRRRGPDMYVPNTW